MGLEWLSRLRQTLEEAGFRTEMGYPGHKAVALTDTVAAVNLGVMDENNVREVLVTILTPRKQGLEACQGKAAQALAVLAGDGSRWQFDRWRYEAGIDCWAIEIHGIPAEVGYKVWIGEWEQPWVTDFMARQDRNRRLIYPHWQGAPSGVTPGAMGWSLKLTQLFPQGESARSMETEPFSVTVVRGNSRQVYTGCCWQSVSIQEKPEGSEVVRSAFALGREVNTDEQNAV